MRIRFKRLIPIIAVLVLLAPAALAYSTLEKGSSGAEVVQLQQALSRLGYSVSADGVYGTQTRNAVKAFQADQKLTVDGKAGDVTQTRLYALASQASAAAAVPARTAATAAPAQAAVPAQAAAAVSVQASAGTPASVYCKDGGKLNLRTGAGSGYRSIALIPTGDQVTVTDHGSKWSYVSWNGMSGYVMTSFLRFDVPVTPVTAAPAPVTAVPNVTPTPANGALTATVVCSDGGKLNLRKTASSGAQVLERIPNGTVLTVYATGTKWYAASYNGQSGYVQGSFLKMGSTPTASPAPVVTPVPTAAPAPVPGSASAVVSCSGSLNLRASASSSAKVIAQIPNGTMLSALKVDDTWYAVTYNGLNGYVMGRYLIVSGGGSAVTATPVPAVPAGDINELQYGEFRYATVQTSGAGLNVRKGPGTTYSRVGEIQNGTRIVVSAIQGSWCTIYYGDIEGYVQRQYISISAAPSGSGQSAAPANPGYDTTVLNRIIRSGYTGADVTMVQQRLIALKYLSSASGTYDSDTIAAVRAFQKRNGLTVDGISGPSTLSQMFSDGALAYDSSAPGSYTSYVIDYNGNTSSAKTTAVRRAQQALRALNYNVPLTGAFEARTHDAIVAFQLRNDITASGVLDAATQTALYSGSARDVSYPARWYLPASAGYSIAAPAGVQLLHWNNDVKSALSGASSVTAYDPATGLSWKLSIMSRGRHLDVQPSTLQDTMIQRKSFVTTSWDIHPVYILLPDGRWTLATMHDYPHGSNTIMNNGFGGQNCVHFLRDMSEAQANDPDYGVRNQEVLRSTWYSMTGTIVN